MDAVASSAKASKSRRSCCAPDSKGREGWMEVGEASGDEDDDEEEEEARPGGLLVVEDVLR